MHNPSKRGTLYTPSSINNTLKKDIIMPVKPQEYRNILEYATKELEKIVVSEDTNYVISQVLQGLEYEQWVQQYKPSRKRVPATGEYGESWNRLWDLWPSMRTFTYKGRKFECQKPFKSNEALCMQKYIDILKTDKVSPEVIYRAAETALAWCMENSYRKGRNEMEFMNGLQPWLNQKQYRNWLEVAMPSRETEPKVVNTMDI